MQKQLRKRTEGFTIIEVLIVLAIAGLILLIVFLAVPALQRNSRNTSRRNDVSKMLGGLQEAVNNNNGRYPDATLPSQAVAGAAGFYECTYTGTPPVTTDATCEVDYDTDPVTRPAVPASILTSGGTGANMVIIRNGYKCNVAANPVTGAGPLNFATANDVLATTFVTQVGASLRNAVAVFSVEIGRNNFQLQCVES